MPTVEVGDMQHEVVVDTPDGPVRIRHVEALSDEDARRVAERAAGTPPDGPAARTSPEGAGR